MLFNSIEYLVFLPIVLMIYWNVLGKYRGAQNAFLLIASYVFYGWWDWRFLSLIIVSSLSDYVIGLKLDSIDNHRKRQWLVAASLTINLGLLGFFKYFNFFIEEAASLSDSIGFQVNITSLEIILPVGISFYTFQTLSYTIDVYRKNLKASKNIIDFFAYVSFFPQLVAGPIERAIHLLPQFGANRSFNYENIKKGLRWILWGLFKKMAIADNCANVVNEVFGNYETLGGLDLMMGAMFFAFQIYCDFSGYSDIAIGSAALLGFDLMTNFRTPYFSRDMAEFWRRWHISLSTWFRDYLYIPLGGSRGAKTTTIRNVLIIFIVSGFWHGANWTFIVWGALNALYFLPSVLLGSNRNNLDTVAQGKVLPGIKELFQMLLTFALTCVAWVFFRAENLQSALDYLSLSVTQSFLPAKEATFETVDWTLIIFFVFIEWLIRVDGFSVSMSKVKFRMVRWLIYSFIISLILLFGAFEKTDFIYFQF
ncbi:MAG TPA: membrane-bound O-acyltransferase family protein [Flavobacteriales bacterium]|nr:membrane-bound O-acyltransferase family protein [Flavobacteriales bacterium]